MPISPTPIIPSEPESTPHPLLKWLGIAAVALASNLAGGLIGYQLHTQSDEQAAHQVKASTDFSMVEFQKIQTAMLVMADRYPNDELKDDLYKIFASGGPIDDPLAAPVYVPPYRNK